MHRSSISVLVGGLLASCAIEVQPGAAGFAGEEAGAGTRDGGTVVDETAGGPGSTSAEPPTTTESGASDDAAAAESTTGDATTNATAGTTEGTANGSDTGEGAAGDPSTTVTCSEPPASYHVAADITAPELHVFGVYEASGGTIAVDLDRTDVPLVVVLSAYESVTWTIDAVVGAQLEEVILNGNEPQTVEGAGDALVTDKSGPFGNLSDCAFAWPGDADCDTEELVADAEMLTGLELATFTGCYEASAFTLE